MKSRQCIIDNKTMNDSEKEAALKVYDQYEMTYRSDQGKIAETTFNVLEYQSYVRRKTNLLNAKVAMERWIDVQNFSNNSRNPIDGIISLISPDNQGMLRGFNMEYLRDTYRAKGFAKIADLISKFGKKGLVGARGDGVLGLKGNKESYTDILAELWGEKDTGNGIAKAMANSIEDVLETQRVLINKYGGNIPKLDTVLPNGKKIKYNIPISHDMVKVRSVPFEQWEGEFRPLLERDSMFNYKTNQPFTDLEFDLLLKDAYESIKTNGLTKVDPAAALQGRRSSGRNLDSNHRVFHFKDSASWLKYQKKYGEGDVFTTILNQVEKNASLIAELKVLGPNSQRTLNYLLEKTKEAVAKQEANNTIPTKQASKIYDSINSAPGKIQNFMDVYHNKGNQVVNRFWAESLSAVRNLASSVMLGRAAITALFGDANTVRATAQDIGMSQSATHKRLLINTLNAHKGKNRNKELMEMGVIMDNSINLAAAQARYAGDISGPVWSQVIPDVVLRITGLSPITTAVRSAFSYEFMGYFADQLGKSYKDLPVNFKRMLVRYELDKDWDILSQIKPYNLDGKKMVSWREIDNAGGYIKNVDLEDLSSRYLAMMQNLNDDAVIISSLRERATTFGSLQRGTWSGEIAKTTLTFKHFAITLLMNHVYRIIKDASINQHFMGVKVNKGLARVILLTEFVGFATLAGGFATQLKEISKGKDPLDMTSAEFWVKAFTAGGGLGILGDVFTNNMAGYTEILGGPTASFAKDSLELTAGNLVDYSQGEDVNFTNDLVKYLKRYTPGQSAWWGGLALQRMLIEGLGKMADPNLESKLRTERRRQESRSETNQKYWWRPGESTPRRAPDLEEANTEGVLQEIQEIIR